MDPARAWHLIEHQIRRAGEILGSGNEVGEAPFEVWHTATVDIVEQAFGEGHRIVSNVRHAGEIDHVLGYDEELPPDHYGERIRQTIPRLQANVRTR